LPFINRASLPGWQYGSWTKLAIVFKGDVMTLLVDDRVALSYETPTNLMADPSYVASLAVTAGDGYTGGSNECDFDNLRVGRLESK
jgi:hypothetical protein